MFRVPLSRSASTLMDMFRDVYNHTSYQVDPGEQSSHPSASERGHLG